MIRTKEDLYTYVNYDKCAYGGKPSKITDSRWSHVGWMVIHILKDWRCNYKVFNFLFALRMHEYYANMQNKGWLEKIAWRYWRKKHDRLGVQLGFDIPINVFGPGLRINHYGLIVVNGNTRVGAFCDIHQGVNIGNWGNETDVPIIGDNVWIGPGAKIFGRIVIGSCCAIGANAVVNKNFPDEGKTIAGVPKEAYNLHYHAYNKKQIEDFIIDVIHGVDRKKNEKEIFYKKNLCPVGERTACDNIINAILNS